MANPNPNFKTWNQRSNEDDYLAADNPGKIKLFHDWHEATAEEFNRTGAWTPETYTQFALQSRKIRQDLTTGVPSDPELITQDYLTEREFQNRRIQGLRQDQAEIYKTKDDIRQEDWRDKLDLAKKIFQRSVGFGTPNAGPKEEAPDPQQALEAKQSRYVERMGRIETAEQSQDPRDLEDAQKVSDVLAGKKESATMDGRLFVKPELYFKEKQEFLDAVNRSDAAPVDKAEAIAFYEHARGDYAAGTMENPGLYENLLHLNAFRQHAEQNPGMSKAELISWWAKKPEFNSFRDFVDPKNTFALATQVVSLTTGGILGQALLDPQSGMVKPRESWGLGLERGNIRLAQMPVMLGEMATGTFGNEKSGGMQMEADIQRLNQTDSAMTQLGAGNVLGLGLDDLAEGGLSLVPTIATALITEGASIGVATGLRAAAAGALKRIAAEGTKKGLKRGIIEHQMRNAFSHKLSRMLTINEMDKLLGTSGALGALKEPLRQGVQRVALGAAAGHQSATATVYNSYLRNREILKTQGYEGPELEKTAREEAVKDGLRAGLVTAVITGSIGLRGAESFALFGKEMAKDTTEGFVQREAFKKTFKQAIKTAVTGETYDAGQKVAIKAAEKAGFWLWAKHTGTESLSEAFEEGLDQAVNSGFDYLRTVENPTLEGYITQVAGAAGLGGLLGGVVGGGTHGVRAVSEPSYRDYQAWVDTDPVLSQAREKVEQLRASGMTQTADALEAKLDEKTTKEFTRASVASGVGADGASVGQTLGDFPQGTVLKTSSGDVGIIIRDPKNPDMVIFRSAEGDREFGPWPADTPLEKAPFRFEVSDETALDEASDDSGVVVAANGDTWVENSAGAMEPAVLVDSRTSAPKTAKAPAKTQESGTDAKPLPEIGPKEAPPKTQGKTTLTFRTQSGDTVTLTGKKAEAAREKITQSLSGAQEKAPWVSHSDGPDSSVARATIGKEAEVEGDTALQGPATITNIETTNSGAILVQITDAKGNLDTVSGHRVTVNGRKISGTVLERTARRLRQEAVNMGPGPQAKKLLARARALEANVEEAQKDPQGGAALLVKSTEELSPKEDAPRRTAPRSSATKAPKTPAAEDSPKAEKTAEPAPAAEEAGERGGVEGQQTLSRDGKIVFDNFKVWGGKEVVLANLSSYPETGPLIDYNTNTFGIETIFVKEPGGMTFKGHQMGVDEAIILNIEAPVEDWYSLSAHEAGHVLQGDDLIEGTGRYTEIKGVVLEAIGDKVLALKLRKNKEGYIDDEATDEIVNDVIADVFERERTGKKIKSEGFISERKLKQISSLVKQTFSDRLSKPKETPEEYHARLVREGSANLVPPPLSTEPGEGVAPIFEETDFHPASATMDQVIAARERIVKGITEQDVVKQLLRQGKNYAQKTGQEGEIYVAYADDNNQGIHKPRFPGVQKTDAELRTGGYYLDFSSQRVVTRGPHAGVEIPIKKVAPRQKSTSVNASATEATLVASSTFQSALQDAAVSVSESWRGKTGPEILEALENTPTEAAQYDLSRDLVETLGYAMEDNPDLQPEILDFVSQIPGVIIGSRELASFTGAIMLDVTGESFIGDPVTILRPSITLKVEGDSRTLKLRARVRPATQDEIAQAHQVRAKRTPRPPIREVPPVEEAPAPEPVENPLEELSEEQDLSEDDLNTQLQQHREALAPEGRDLTDEQLIEEVEAAWVDIFESGNNDQVSIAEILEQNDSLTKEDVVQYIKAGVAEGNVDPVINDDPDSLEDEDASFIDENGNKVIGFTIREVGRMDPDSLHLDSLANFRSALEMGLEDVLTVGEQFASHQEMVDKMIENAKAVFPWAKFRLTRNQNTPVRYHYIRRSDGRTENFILINRETLAEETWGLDPSNAASVIARYFFHEAAHAGAVNGIRPSKIYELGRELATSRLVEGEASAKMYLRQEPGESAAAYGKRISRYLGRDPEMTSEERRAAQWRAAHEYLRQQKELLTNGETQEQALEHLSQNPGLVGKVKNYLKRLVRKLKQWARFKIFHQDPSLHSMLDNLETALYRLEHGLEFFADPGEEVFDANANSQEDRSLESQPHYSKTPAAKEVLIQDLARAGISVDKILAGEQSDGSIRYTDRNNTLWKIQNHPNPRHFATLDVRDSTLANIGGKPVRLTLLEKVKNEDGSYNYTFLIHRPKDPSLKQALRDAAVLSIARTEGSVGGRPSSIPTLSLEQAEGFVADFLGETQVERQTHLDEEQERQAFDGSQELLEQYHQVDLRGVDTVHALDERDGLENGMLSSLAGPKARGFVKAKAAGKVFLDPNGKERFEIDPSKSKIKSEQPLNILNSQRHTPLTRKEWVLRDRKDQAVFILDKIKELGYVDIDTFINARPYEEFATYGQQWRDDHPEPESYGPTAPGEGLQRGGYSAGSLHAQRGPARRPYQSPRLPESVLLGGRGTSEAENILAAANVTSRVHQAVEKLRLPDPEQVGPGRKALNESIRANESKLLKAWAEKKGLLQPWEEFDEQWREQGTVSGGEHDLYVDEDGRYHKRQIGPAAAVVESGFFGTYQDYLFRLALHNTFFPETPFTLEGFSVSPENATSAYSGMEDLLPTGILMPIVSQPGVQILYDKDGQQVMVEPQERDAWMARRGFSPLRGGDGTAYVRTLEDGTTIEVSDLHDDNIVVLASEKGKAPGERDLAVIDADINIVPEAQAKALRTRDRGDLAAQRTAHPFMERPTARVGFDLINWLANLLPNENVSQIRGLPAHAPGEDKSARYLNGPDTRSLAKRLLEVQGTQVPKTSAGVPGYLGIPVLGLKSEVLHGMQRVGGGIEADVYSDGADVYHAYKVTPRGGIGVRMIADMGRGDIRNSYGDARSFGERILLSQVMPGARSQELLGMTDDGYLITRAPDLPKAAGLRQRNVWFDSQDTMQTPYTVDGDKHTYWAHAGLVKVGGEIWLIDDMHNGNFRVDKAGNPFLSDFNAQKLSPETIRKMRLDQRDLDRLPDLLPQETEDLVSGSLDARVWRRNPALQQNLTALELLANGRRVKVVLEKHPDNKLTYNDSFQDIVGLGLSEQRTEAFRNFLNSLPIERASFFGPRKLENAEDKVAFVTDKEFRKYRMSEHPEMHLVFNYDAREMSVSLGIQGSTIHVGLMTNLATSKKVDGKWITPAASNLAGLELLTALAIHAPDLGVNKIVTQGVSNPKEYGPMTGAMTWPRLGFDGKIPADAPSEVRKASGLSRSVRKLVSTPEGLAAWRDYTQSEGATVDYTFDLTPGSQSIKTLAGVYAGLASTAAKVEARAKTGSLSALARIRKPSTENPALKRLVMAAQGGDEAAIAELVTNKELRGKAKAIFKYVAPDRKSEAEDFVSDYFGAPEKSSRKNASEYGHGIQFQEDPKNGDRFIVKITRGTQGTPDYKRIRKAFSIKRRGKEVALREAQEYRDSLLDTLPENKQAWRGGAFLRQTVEKFDPTYDAFMPWFTQATRLHAYNYKARINRTSGTSLDENRDYSQESATTFDSDARELIYQALKRLPARQQQLIRARFWEQAAPANATEEDYQSAQEALAKLLTRDKTGLVEAAFDLESQASRRYDPKVIAAKMALEENRKADPVFGEIAQDYRAPEGFFGPDGDYQKTVLQKYSPAKGPIDGFTQRTANFSAHGIRGLRKPARGSTSQAPAMRSPENVLEAGSLAASPWGRRQRMPIFTSKGNYQRGGLFTAEGNWTKNIFRLLELARGKKAAALDLANELHGRMVRALQAEFGRDPANWPIEVVNRALGNTENRITRGQIRTMARLQQQGLTAARATYMTLLNRAAGLEQNATLGNSVTIRGRLVSDPVTLRAEAALLRQQARARFTHTMNTVRTNVGHYEQSARTANRAQALMAQANAMRSLPAPVQAIVRRTRREIDDLSQELMAVGAISGPLKATIADNMGLYLHRSYRIFDSDSWTQQIMDQSNPEAAMIRARAERFIRQDLVREMVQNGATKATAQASVTPEMIHQRLMDYLSVADSQSGGLLYNTVNSKEGAKPTNILKRIGPIPKPIQELWGVYNDPSVNAARSLVSIGTYLAHHEFLTRLRDMGLSEGWLTPGPALGPDGKPYVEILGANAANPRYTPLAGLYGPAALKDAFSGEFVGENRHPFLKVLQILTGVAMMTKTVYSHPATMRNFVGNIFPTAANGHLGIMDFFSRARFQALSERVFNRGTEATRAQLRRYVQLGIIGDSVTENLVNELSNMTPSRFDDRIGTMLVSQFGRGLKKTHEGFVKIYGMQDDFWKIVAFENELGRVQRYRAGSGMSQAEMEAEAADITKDTMFSYSRAPLITQQLRTQPFIAPFVTFSSEVIRTGFNTVRIGLRQYLEGKRTGNKALAAAGRERIVGTALVTIGIYGLLKGLQQMFDYDDRDMDDLRRHLPDWEKDSQLAMLPRNSDGSPNYYNMTYINPYDLWWRPFRAVARKLNDPDATAAGTTWAFIDSTLDPVAKEQIFFGAVMDVMRGVDAQGKKIYDSGDTEKTKLFKSMQHALVSVLEPGTLKAITNIEKARTGYVSTGGRKYVLWQETVNGVLGQKFQSVDLHNSLTHSMKKFNYDVRDASSTFTKLFTSTGTQSDKDLRESFLEANRKRERAFLKARQKVVSALRIGAITLPEVRRIMESEKMSQKERNAILRNIYPRYEPTLATIDIAREKGEARGQDRVRIWKEVRELWPKEKTPLSLDDWDLLETP